MDQKYQELVKWADNNGGFLHSSCFFHTVLSGGGGALSVKSDGQIEPFSIFLRMPYCLTLSYFNAVSAGNEGSHYIPRSKPLPDAFIHKTADHDTVSAVFLMQQYLLGSESFWHP